MALLFKKSVDSTLQSAYSKIMQISFTIQIFKERGLFVAYIPEFDISTCGTTIEEARKNADDALAGVLESAQARGVLDDLLDEAGYAITGEDEAYSAPEFCMFEKGRLTLLHA